MIEEAIMYQEGNAKNELSREVKIDKPNTNPISSTDIINYSAENDRISNNCQIQGKNNQKFEHIDVKCKICMNVVGDDILQNHYEVMHLEEWENIYHCKACSYFSKQKDHTEKHYYKHHLDPKSLCPNCQFQCPNYEAMTEHHASKHDGFDDLCK